MATAQKPAADATTKKTSPDRAANFKRLASKRVQKGINAIRLVGSLGSANYVRTADQVERIYNVLLSELDTMRKQLAPGTPAAKAAPTFEL